MDAAQSFVRTARDAADLVEPHLEGCARDRIIVLHLDADRRLIRLAVMAGDEGDSTVRGIVADALRLDSAGLVLAYRSAADPVPSCADIAAARALSQAAASLGIAVHDHLVFAGGECRSLRALGLI